MQGEGSKTGVAEKRADGGQFFRGDIMKVTRESSTIFIVRLNDAEMRKLLCSADKWDEKCNAVLKKIIEAGFDEGCDL